MSTSVKIAIDATLLSSFHGGGKDQVLLNLLKGFEALKQSERFRIVCYPEQVSALRAIIPSGDFICLPKRREEYQRNKGRIRRILTSLWVRNFPVHRALKESGCQMVFFPTYNTSMRRLPIPSIFIPHDTQTMRKDCGISLWARMCKNIPLWFDIRLRDRVVAISRFDESEIRRFFPKQAYKIIQIYNPIDMDPPEIFDPVREKNIVAINVQFCHKNTSTLIHAFELLEEQNELSLILIGKISPYTVRLKSYVEERELQDRIIFTDFISKEALDNYLDNCALYVNPTFYEGFGMTAVEAIIRGVPTLVSDVTANRETTRDLCNYYSPAGDPEALASAMAEALNRPYDPAAAEARSREICQAYNYRTIAGRYLELFRSVADMRGAKEREA